MIFDYKANISTENLCDEWQHINRYFSFYDLTEQPYLKNAFLEYSNLICVKLEIIYNGELRWNVTEQGIWLFENTNAYFTYTVDPDAELVYWFVSNDDPDIENQLLFFKLRFA